MSLLTDHVNHAIVNHISRKAARHLAPSLITETEGFLRLFDTVATNRGAELVAETELVLHDRAEPEE